MTEKRIEQLTKIVEEDRFSQKISDYVKEIREKHHQIIEDWCKAYMAELYEKGFEIKPGMFVLNEQITDCGYKFWFTIKDNMDSEDG